MAITTLHLTNAFHPTSGGIRTFYRALLSAADDRERRMRLVVPAADDGVEMVGRWCRIDYLKARPAPAFDRQYRMLTPWSYLRPGRSRLATILCEERPDLVEICDKYSLFYLAALIRKGLVPRLPRPVLVGLSCERMDDNVAAYVSAGAPGRAFCRWYLRHIYGPPFDYHLANSEYTAGELRTALWDRRPGFIQVCPMGVDVSRFTPALRDEALRSRLLGAAGGTDASTLLLYAGRLAPEKNVLLLIEALEILAGDAARDFRLVLAGQGPQAAAIDREAARRTPGRVLRLGAVDDRDWLARCYASADVFVHPNLKEPFGIAPLEAMASGVPVVLPSGGGVLSYASERNAWLADAGGASFAAAIGAAAAWPDRARVARALQTAQAHQWSAVAARWFDLYDRLARVTGGSSHATTRRPRPAELERRVGPGDAARDSRHLDGPIGARPVSRAGR